MSGTIDAHSSEDAMRKLAAMPLRVMRLEAAGRPRRAKPLGRDDFLAFNQQLAHLTAAGLPVEQGLRLIARDMRSGRMAESVRQVADELERGTPLPDAFAKHRGRFPTIYSALIDAGVRAGNLPAMLMSLARHMELETRLRAALWRAFSYPLMVVAMLLLVLVFLGVYVLPTFREMFQMWGTSLPSVTLLLMRLPDAVPWIIGIALVLLIGWPVLWQALRSAGQDQAARDALLLPLPLIGPVLRNNLIARWCDALRLGIDAGLDLPAAMRLASDAVGSPRLQRDTEKLAEVLESGQPLEESPHRVMLPPALLSLLHSAPQQADLPLVLDTLSSMYQQMAEVRLAQMQNLLLPILLIALGLLMAFVVIGLFAPFITLIQVIS